MGTIQPARFLSHSGQILPGVRRVVNVATPAAGNDWTVIVPAGVQWSVRAGAAIFQASAQAATRLPGSRLTIDGVIVWQMYQSAGIDAGGFNLFSYTTATSPTQVGGLGDGVIIPFPDVWIPEGSLVQSFTNSLQSGDTYGNVALLIEEVYVTNAQLSELERANEALELKMARSLAAAATTNNGA